MTPFELLEYFIDEEHKTLNEMLENLKTEELSKTINSQNTTVGQRFAHIFAAEFNMAGYLYPKDGEERLKAENLTVEELKSLAKTSKARHLETIQNLSISDLDKMWTSQVSGNSYSYKWLLYHFIEHIATHRGQLTTALREIRSK